jgi:hypothetical protein
MLQDQPNPFFPADEARVALAAGNLAGLGVTSSPALPIGRD